MCKKSLRKKPKQEQAGSREKKSGSKINKKEIILGFITKIEEDHVGAYAAQAAYFIIMAFIPFILFLTTLIRYTDITYNMLSASIRSFVPVSLQGFVMELVSEVYNRNTVIMPITALLALWSSGKAIQALINGLNTIYRVKETRNWLINRIYAVFYTMLFAVAIISSFLLLVVGDRIEKALNQVLPVPLRFFGMLMGGKNLIVFAALFLIFVFLYRALPNRPATFRSQMPGALIIAVGWSIFSSLFSLYFELFPAMNNMYGSLTALIILMFWLYFCMNFVLYGAAINAHFEKQFRQAKDSVVELLHTKSEDSGENP
ncbi:MAG: YihY/virulence factor BrkB family protein [Blautia sp.]|nr:YihY/virulence factor BrkB family protein [Blautia sp.]